MLRSTRAAYAPYLIFLLIAAFLLFLSNGADARGVRGGTAQSVHAGGARAGGGGNLNRAAGASRDLNRNTNANRNINNNRDVNRNVNRNVNRDVNVNRDIDIDVDVDNGWDGHPVARGVAFGAAAAVTAAAIGSVMYTLPPSCPMRPYGSLTYYYCGDVWYEPRYSGSSVTYVVVQQPY